MKKTCLIFLSFLFALNLFAEEDILEAIQQKKITVKFSYTQLGKDGLKMTVTNLTKSKLSLSLSPGTLFIPKDSSEQTLMNVDEEFFVLEPAKNATKMVDGYCIHLSKSAPSLSQTFTMGQTKNANLISMLSFIKSHPVTESNYQAAIWAITDHSDIASIDPITDADAQFRKHIATITHRKDPWYSKPQTIVANPGEQIQRNSVHISGVIEIHADKTYEVYLTVENSKGEVKMKLKPMTIQKDWDNSFEFKVKAAKWEVGDYKVIIRRVSDNKEVKHYDFSV